MALHLVIEVEVPGERTTRLKVPLSAIGATSGDTQADRDVISAFASRFMQATHVRVEGTTTCAENNDDDTTNLLLTIPVRATNTSATHTASNNNGAANATVTNTPATANAPSTTENNDDNMDVSIPPPPYVRLEAVNFTVQCHDGSGKHFLFKAKTCHTGGFIRKKICELNSIPVEGGSLFLNGSPVGDDMSLSQLRVKNDDVLPFYV